MSKDTDNSLFVVFSMPRFYQQLLSGIGSYQELGNRIINRIKAAHAFRQIEQVRELSRILINVPIKEYQLIAQYYLVWCKCRDYEYPAATLEKIIEQTRTYKTKALFSRAAIEIYHGNLEHALYFYSEASKSHPTVSEYIDLSRSIAGLKSLEGFHDSALGDLEKLIPLIKHAEPRLYYDFLNSYAVELGIAGHKQEARNISQLVLTSPFAYAYPEWQQTAEDLKGPNRSFVVIQQSHYVPQNVLQMPVFERVNTEPPT
jgi:tetratricopeptide (TPR) repeat protein